MILFNFTQPKKKAIILSFSLIFSLVCSSNNNSTIVNSDDGEPDLRLVNLEYVEVTYSTGKKFRYSLADIHREKINLQFLVFMGYMVVNSALYSILADILILDKG